MPRACQSLIPASSLPLIEKSACWLEGALLSPRHARPSQHVDEGSQAAALHAAQDRQLLLHRRMMRANVDGNTPLDGPSRRPPYPCRRHTPHESGGARCRALRQRQQQSMTGIYFMHQDSRDMAQNSETVCAKCGEFPLNPAHQGSVRHVQVNHVWHRRDQAPLHLP
jgi:hypothetical protein